MRCVLINISQVVKRKASRRVTWIWVVDKATKAHVAEEEGPPPSKKALVEDEEYVLWVEYRWLEER